jgi:hypothetical protein
VPTCDAERLGGIPTQSVGMRKKDKNQSSYD